MLASSIIRKVHYKLCTTLKIPLSAGVIGAIISSTILEQNTVNGSEVSPNNEILQFCGANDCPGNNVTNPNLEEPDSTLVRLSLKH